MFGDNNVSKPQSNFNKIKDYDTKSKKTNQNKTASNMFINKNLSKEQIEENKKKLDRLLDEYADELKQTQQNKKLINNQQVDLSNNIVIDKKQID